MSSVKRSAVAYCTGVVSVYDGSGIALLPANLASIGGIAIWGLGNFYYWGNVAGLCLCGLAIKPSTGWPIAYAGEISPAFGFQTGVLYYHANWIGKQPSALRCFLSFSTRSSRH